MWVLGFECRAQEFGFRVEGSGLRVQGSGFELRRRRRVGLGSRVQRLASTQSASIEDGFRVSGFGFTVQGFEGSANRLG